MIIMPQITKFNRSYFLRSFFVLTIIVFGSTVISFGQEKEPARNNQRPGNGPLQGFVVRQLGLTKEQVAQFRAIKEEWKAARQQAQRSHRQATRELDAAIYADNMDEVLIRERIKAVQDAQAEMTRIRFAEEVAIRGILTPEQLTRFREARKRFAENRDAANGQRQGVRERLPQRRRQ